MGQTTIQNTALVVDLDGTLLLTDTLHESILTLISNNPLYLLVLPFWLIFGKSRFKARVAARVNLDVTSLPYNEIFISWLNEEKATRKKIVLCTASNERIAHAIADHLQLFDEVIASNTNNNIKSDLKRKVLEERFGLMGYDYAGNSSADLKVWEGARLAFVVNAKDQVYRKAAKSSNIARVFPRIKISFSHWSKLLRMHQWIKNFLIFVPLISAQQIYNIQLLSKLIVGYAAFCLCSSAVYLINDLLDLKNDRKHPQKRYRPLAAAIIPISTGVLLALALTITSISLGFMIEGKFALCLASYFLLSSLYSLWLKRLVLIDTLLLAILYTSRIIAGALAIQTPISIWILAFSVFFFYCLACLKRYNELYLENKSGLPYSNGRNYSFSDMGLLQSMGIAAGYGSIIIFSLYLNSDKVLNLYASPEFTWLSIPLLLFWISHIWLKSLRGEVHEDPVLFAITDKVSLVIGLMLMIFFWLAR